MDSSFLERLSQLETRFDKFSMVGTDDVLVAGNLKSGFTVNVGIQGSGIKGGGGGTGACCYDDGTCDVLTEIDCTNAGGNYQGDGTNCSITGICLGACCEGDGGHTCVPNSTPDSCADDGGTFHGFGSTCDPNPCPPMPPCNGCGFDAFDGSGRKFLTRTTVTSINQTVDCPCGNPQDIGEWTCIDSYDSECNLTHNVSGSETVTPCVGDPFPHAERCDCFGDVISATERHFFFHDDSGCTHQTTEETCTLSDECTP